MAFKMDENDEVGIFKEHIHLCIYCFVITPYHKAFEIPLCIVQEFRSVCSMYRMLYQTDFKSKLDARLWMLGIWWFARFCPPLEMV